MAINPTLQKAVQDINRSLRGKPITGVKGPIAPWYGAYAPPSREDMGFVPNEEWDYKAANRTGGPGMEGQPLPEDAKGWDKYGRAYYGATAQGWLKKHDANIKANWEEALAQESKWKQLTGGVSAILKGTGGVVLDALLVGPGKALKRGMGVTSGLADIGEVPEGQEVLAGRYEKTDVPEPTKSGVDFPGADATLPKLPGSDLAARIVTSAPLIGEAMANIGDQSLQSYLNRLGAYSQNAVNALKPAINPEIVGYNLARIALDRDNYQDNLAEIEANWHASSILYSTVVNPATRAEFDRRVKGGEDPGLLAMELENPVVEFVGEMIFDPWNLWIGPGKKAADAAYLSNASKVFMPADEVADALKVFKHHDEAEALASLSKLSEASAATAAKTIGNRAADLSMIALNTNGKRSALVDTGGQVAQWISYNVNNPDDILELFQALERRAGGSADEVAEATAKIMSIAKRAKASPGVLFSPASFDLGYTLRQVMKGDPQKFLDDFAEIVATGAKGADEGAAVASKADDAARVEGRVKSLNDKFADDLSKHGRAQEALARLAADYEPADLAMMQERVRDLRSRGIKVKLYEVVETAGAGKGTKKLVLVSGGEDQFVKVGDELVPWIDQTLGALGKGAKEIDVPAKAATEVVESGAKIGAAAQKGSTKAALAEHAYKLLDDAAEKIYPSVAKRLKDGEDIGYVARAMHKMDKGIVGKFYKQANNFFANVYMGMTPGYAMRNVLMDNALIWLDMGPTNPFSASKWHDIGAKWQGGAITRAAERGISSPLAAAGVTTKGKTTWYNWGIGLAEKFEKNSAKSIVGKSIDKTMRKMLGKGLPTLDPLIKAGGMSDDVSRFLINTTMNNYGDTSVAVNALRSRDIEVWKHISQWLDDDTMKALDGMGLLPSMLDSLAMSGNVDDALRNAGAVFDEVDALARSAMDEMPVVSRSNPALPDVVAVDLATDGEKVKFSAVVEADNKSMLSSIDSMNASRRAARNAVHTLPQSRHQELKTILDKYPLDESAFGALNDFATKHGDTFKSATKKIKNSRKPVDLVEAWDDLGIGALRGEPAALITDTSIPYKARKQAFLSEAHRAFIDRKTAYWKIVREEFYGQATGLYGELSTYMANTFGTPMNDSSMQIASRLFQEADVYEQAYAFEDGLHYLTRGQPIAIGGAGGETVYASLNDGLENPQHFLNALNAKDEAGEFLYRSKGMPRKVYKDTTEVTSEVAYDMMLNRRMSKTREQIAAQFPEGVIGDVAEAGDEMIDIWRGRAPGMRGAGRSWTSERWVAEKFGGEGGDLLHQRIPRSVWESTLEPSLEKLKNLDPKFVEQGLERLIPDEWAQKGTVIGAVGDEVVAGSREATEQFVKIAPPQAEDGSPTLARALYDQQEAVTGLRQKVLSGLDGARGERMVLAETDVAEDALKQWQEAANIQIQEARMLSQGVATETRDFILHDYRAKRNYNQVAGYVYPYHFWYEQTYKKMAQRMASNPAIASNYMRYKDTLGKLHAGAPDWWKYTINSNELLGLDMENPIYFNLEASLNPMNGLTNVDFDDPYKRTSWFTGLLQDMGKFGPSTHTIFSLATALALYSQGEEDAANRWAGRIIPQTRTIKAISALAFDKPVEIDPWVALLGGGLDPYERNRVGRALGAMANEGKYTEAELLDAANKQSGPLWDEAILRATKERAPGQISSFFLGAGFKGRTNSDIQIDKFYGDWHRLWEMEPNYSPQEMQRAMSDMRKAYPFMDTLMLSKKGGLDRDRAYVYNVLSRIPPSMSDDIAKAADLNPELLRRFYDDKGHTETWPEQDRDRFMAGIVDIAAVLDMPDNATRDAWLNSKTAYQAMLEIGEDNFGNNIWELEDTYYALMGDDPDDRQQAYDMLDANPVLEQAMKWKDQTIMFSPTLSAYYTSLDKIEAYYRGEMYAAIEKELGADIWDKWDSYNEAKYRSDEEARAYWKSHPELERYMDIKEDWEDLIATNVINVGSLIKPGPGPQVRDILGEMGVGSGGVQDFAEQYKEQMKIPPELLQLALGNEAYNLLMDGKPYPPVLERKLELMGFTEEVLEMILGGAQ